MADEFVCCGLHAVCERDAMRQAEAAQPDYFDDEELDVYRGRAADAYTDAEADEFRDVLYTMLEAEVPEWLLSLQHRGVELPDSVRAEAMQMAAQAAV